MNRPPFGFGPPGDPDEHGDAEDSGDERNSGSGDVPAPGGPGASADPFSMLFGMSSGPQDIGEAFQRLGKLLSWSGGPVNWDLARDVARQTVAGSVDPSVGTVERREIEDAFGLAEHWLDPHTVFPAAFTRTDAWSRAQWVELTLPAWRKLIDPVAAKVVDAMGAALTQQGPGGMPGLGEQMQGLAGQLGGMMRSMGGAMFGAQVGQGLGSVAAEVVGSTDVGLPLGPDGLAVLLPANVRAFGSGLSVPLEDVRLYLALREAAHHRLFSHVGWLRGRLQAQIEAYARGIGIDTSRIEEAMSQFDPANPAGIQEALQAGLLEPKPTPEQQEVLDRLEVLLALVEGWVDEVSFAAAGSLPSASALRETMRRRRATGGPAEQTFASLVGLELRPRRLREAAALWAGLRDARGIEGRDAVWAHPDLLPSATDLDAPGDFVAGTGALDLSALLEAPPPPEEDGGDTPPSHDS